MGVIHFNCLADAEGVTLRWAEEMIAVAEPSAAATDFLSRSRAKRGTLAELCARDTRVEVDGALHTVLGKHVQRDDGVGGGEVGAYLFRRAAGGEVVEEASGLSRATRSWCRTRLFPGSHRDHPGRGREGGAGAVTRRRPRGATTTEARAPGRNVGFRCGGFLQRVLSRAVRGGRGYVAALGAAALVSCRATVGCRR